MSGKIERQRQAETQFSIDTATSEAATGGVRSMSRTFSLDENSPDGLYFKSNERLNGEREEHLSLLYKEAIEKQAMEVAEDAEKKHTYEIFEFDQASGLNENIPGVNMSFLDRLFHQLTRKAPSESDFDSDDVFVAADEREITTVSNEYTNVDDNYNAQTDRSFWNALRAYIGDLTEEVDVIRGKLDEDLLVHRRSLRRQSLDSSTDSSQLTAF